MDIRRLPGDEPAIRRFIEALWLPYKRELEATVDEFALDSDADVVAEELDHRPDRHDSDQFEAWVAVDDAPDRADPADSQADPVGFITTDVDEAPTVFDRPDRLLICDIYVDESRRGTGLADELVEQATARARERGCAELTLDVDVDNDRARAFYERLGFETVRHTMVADVPAGEESRK
ncbi:GNAT family N-acetyltransferase [Halobaculum sp. D14]|uniref:GNAT family N-acetyltransferase n=1 Tax=Halobaculum sp. D14 TaxID=3421642 RepID=UPI003EC0EE99